MVAYCHSPYVSARWKFKRLESSAGRKRDTCIEREAVWCFEKSVSLKQVKYLGSTLI